MRVCGVYRILKAALVLIFGNCLSLFANAEKGFDQGSFPQAVQNAKASVFVILAQQDSKYEIGAAGVIRQERRGNVQYLYLLTVQHVLKDFCASSGTCKVVMAAREPKLDYSNYYWKEEGKFPKVMQVEILAADAARDLALLKIAWRENFEVPVLALAPSCKPVSTLRYTIGFPMGFRRYDNLDIPRPYAALKRMSRGEVRNPVYLDLQTKRHSFEPIPDAYKLDGSSVDSLPGNSGGPMLDEAGNLVGVQRAAASMWSNAFAYTGSGSDPHTAAVPCEEIRNFLAELKF